MEPLCICQGLLISRVSDGDTLITTFLTEYMFTFTFENNQILSTTEFVDATLINGFLYNETVAAEACLG